MRARIENPGITANFSKTVGKEGEKVARKNKVRLDLEQQLKDKGLYTPAYISLLDD